MALSLIHFTLADLICFQCSEFSGDLKCPLASESPTTWAQDSAKYSNLTGNDVFCAIGYSNLTKKVYYQVRKTHELAHVIDLLAI